MENSFINKTTQNAKELLAKMLLIKATTSMIVERESLLKETEQILEEAENIDVEEEIQQQVQELDDDISMAEDTSNGISEKIKKTELSIESVNKLNYKKNVWRIIKYILFAILGSIACIAWYNRTHMIGALLLMAIYDGIILVIMWANHVIDDYKNSKNKDSMLKKLENEIGDLKQQKKEIKNEISKLEAEKSSYADQKRKTLEESISKAKTAVEELKSEIKKLYNELKDIQGDIILIKNDWVHIDKILQMLSSGRAETIKDCLNQIDILNQFGSLSKSMENLSSELGATINVGIESIGHTIQDSLRVQSIAMAKMMDAVSESMSNIARTQERTSEALNKTLRDANDTNRDIAHDLHDIQTKYRYGN